MKEFPRIFRDKIIFADRQARSNTWSFITYGSRMVCVLLLGVLIGPLSSMAKDVAGSHDCPLVSRYTGSTIIGYVHRAYGEMDMPTGAATKARTFAKTRHVEGELWRIIYMDPAERSPLEVFRNYELGLKKAGFTIIFSCEKEQCGRDFNELVYAHTDRIRSSPAARDAFMLDQDRHYLAAELKNDKGVADVSLYVALDGNAGYNYKGAGRVMTYLRVVKHLSMEKNMVTIDAAAMARDLAAKGHVAIYGLYFDTDKATLKADSKPALQQMANLLANEPKLKVYIVGHTDNVGALGYNLKLSSRRAEAITRLLETTYHIAPSRLVAEGVGPLAPVDSNDTAAGRAKNRRVEMVKQ